MNVVDLLLKLLSFKSLTPDDDGSLKFIEEFLHKERRLNMPDPGNGLFCCYHLFTDNIRVPAP